MSDYFEEMVSFLDCCEVICPNVEHPPWQGFCLTTQVVRTINRSVCHHLFSKTLQNEWVADKVIEHSINDRNTHINVFVCFLVPIWGNVV